MYVFLFYLRGITDCMYLGKEVLNNQKCARFPLRILGGLKTGIHEKYSPSRKPTLHNAYLRGSNFREFAKFYEFSFLLKITSIKV